jgi:hypothetical protein
MNRSIEGADMKKVAKPAKDIPAAARSRTARPQARGVRGQDLGDRRLQLLLNVKTPAR